MAKIRPKSNLSRGFWHTIRLEQIFRRTATYEPQAIAAQ
jgi:hypothetical protein